MFISKSAAILGMTMVATLASSAVADVLNYQGNVTQGGATFKVYLSLRRPDPKKYPSQAFADGRIDTQVPGNSYVMQSGAMKDGGQVNTNIYFSGANAGYIATKFLGQMSGSPGTPSSKIDAKFTLRYYNKDYVGVPVTLSPVYAAPPVVNNTQVQPRVANSANNSATSSPTVTPTVTFSGTPKKLFTTYNTAQTFNAPRVPAAFSFTNPFKVTTLQTYHWNNGQGAAPGTLGLLDSKGKMYGPWPVTTYASSGSQNVNWICQPQATLPAGQYTVIDSSQATWSHNPASGGRGFVDLEGLTP